MSLNKRLEEVNDQIVRLRKEMKDAEGAKDWEEVKKKLVRPRKRAQGRVRADSAEGGKTQTNAPHFQRQKLLLGADAAPASQHEGRPTLEPLLEPLRQAFYNTEFDPAYGGVPKEFGWGIMGKGEHAGVSSCFECHPNIVKLWKQTPHAQSYAKLPAEDRKKKNAWSVMSPAGCVKTP